MPHRDRVLLALAIWSLPALAAAQEPDPLPPLTREVYATGFAETTGGDPNAQNALGMAYRIGWGVVPQDYPTSVEWYRLAAEQGRAEAQFHLGGTYGLGQGVPEESHPGAQMAESSRITHVPGSGLKRSRRHAIYWPMKCRLTNSTPRAVWAAEWRPSTWAEVQKTR